MIDKNDPRLNDPRLTAYVLGELPTNEVAEIEQQIQDSPELQEAVDNIRVLTSELGLAYQSEEQLRLLETQKNTLAPNRTPTPPPTPPQKNSSRFRIALSFAACLAVLAFGGWLWRGNATEGYLASGWTFYSPATNSAPSDYLLDDSVSIHSQRDADGLRPDDMGRDAVQPGASAYYVGDLVKPFELSDREDEDLDLDEDGESEYQPLKDLITAALPAERFRDNGGDGGGDGDGFIRDERGPLNAPSNRRPAEFLFRGEHSLITPEDLLGRVNPTGTREIRINRQFSVNERSPRKPIFPANENGVTGQFKVPDGADDSEDTEQSRTGDRSITPSGGKNNQNGKSKPDLSKKPRPKSWKRVRATPNTTRLMVGNKEELSLNGMQVNAQVDGFRARVLVDYFYYNDQDRQLEGNFKLRLPDDASLYYFAFGESVYQCSPAGKLADEEFLADGTQFVSLAAPAIKRSRQGQWDNVKEARMVPREKAAHAFRETVRRRVDPALVEWSGAGVFTAKVFPLSPRKLHRIVVGYDVNLKRVGDDLKFELSLPEQTGQCKVEVNVQSIEGATCVSEPFVDPIPSDQDGILHQRFVFDADAEPLTGVSLTLSGAKDVVLKSDAEQNKGFWTTQVTPDLPSEAAASNSRAIFMLDTSLSSNPDKFNVWLNLLEQTLTNNRDSLKEFDVLFFNIDTHFWKGKYVANSAENVDELKQVLEKLALEGATDLFAAANAITNSKWITAGDNGPDLFLLSDGAATWGETDLRIIGQRLQSADCGSLFAYQTGLTGTAISNLRFLAGQSGGAVFSVATEAETQTASTAHRKRPWKLTSIVSAGAKDILSAGRVEYVYPGQTITVVGRGEVKPCLELSFEQGEDELTKTFTPVSVSSQLASRMYGHVSVGQLENLGANKLAQDVATAYARHFRITGRTCSLLMLESEEDYQRFDIKPEEDKFVVNAKAASTIVNDTLKQHATTLADPKARLKAWLKRLESMPGMKFQWPTALELVFDDIEVDTISQPLSCTLTEKETFSKSYITALEQRPLDYDTISAEALARKGKSVDDTLKVYSSLIERSPGDITVARDVAFTAMELGRPAAAFHLLRRVAHARPFQGNIYPAIGQCLAQLGKSDMAMVYYEIALNGTFERQGNEFKSIVAAEYTHLLRQMVSGKLDASAAGREYAKARLDTLGKHLPFSSADVLITMMWNQDQTDVDLHIVEPSGEECFYKHADTRSGGHITSDITTGFGPEMYYNANAPVGQYQVKAKFFGSSQNRRSTRNKVYITIIEDFGGEAESLRRETVELRTVGEIEKVISVGVK